MPLKKQEELNEVIENDEPLARYIYEKKHFSKENKRVKEQAFHPPKDKTTVSVIRHKDCPKDCILKIGEKLRNKNVKAVGSILTKDVRSMNGLDVESDTSGNQHRRHANIRNFTKALKKKLAQGLARETTLLYVLD